MTTEKTQRALQFLIKSAATPLNPTERKDVLENACYLSEGDNINLAEAELLLTAIEARNTSMDGNRDFDRTRNDLVITDSQLLSQFENVNIPTVEGDADKQRAYIANACLKTSAGFWNGAGIFNIMRSLGLVEDIPSPRLTLLGGYFLFQTFYDKTLS